VISLSLVTLEPSSRTPQSKIPSLQNKQKNLRSIYNFIQFGVVSDLSPAMQRCVIVCLLASITVVQFFAFSGEAGPVISRGSSNLQFNITKPKFTPPISANTAALLALTQAIIMSAIVVVGLFCGPSPPPIRRVDRSA
jgi:hypothetical protein